MRRACLIIATVALMSQILGRTEVRAGASTYIPPTRIALNQYSCTDDTAEIDHFGLKSCNDLIYRLTSRDISQPLSVLEPVLVMGAALYDGTELAPDFRDVAMMNATPLSKYGLCAKPDPSNAAQPLKLSGVVCNIGEGSDEEMLNGHGKGEACVASWSQDYTPDSKGYCDFSLIGRANSIDYTAICPREFTWMRSVRAQVLQSRYENVIAELNNGTINLTQAPDGSYPCQALAVLIDRARNGVGDQKASTGNLRGANTLRQQLRALNNAAPAGIQFDEVNVCNSSQSLARERGGGLAGADPSNAAACYLRTVYGYIEYLTQKLAVCEVYSRTEQLHNKLLLTQARFFQGLTGTVIDGCKAAAIQAVNNDPAQMSWTNPVFRGAFYSCYQPAAKAYFKAQWHAQFPVVKSFTSQLKSVTDPSTGQAPVQPLCQMSLIELPLLLRALARARRRRRGAALGAAALILLTGHAALAGGGVGVTSACPRNNATSTSQLDASCVCTAKLNACELKVNTEADGKIKTFQGQIDAIQSNYVDKEPGTPGEYNCHASDGTATVYKEHATATGMKCNSGGPHGDISCTLNSGTNQYDCVGWPSDGSGYCCDSNDDGKDCDWVSQAAAAICMQQYLKGQIAATNTQRQQQLADCQTKYANNGCNQEIANAADCDRSSLLYAIANCTENSAGDITASKPCPPGLPISTPPTVTTSNDPTPISWGETLLDGAHQVVGGGTVFSIAAVAPNSSSSAATAGLASPDGKFTKGAASISGPASSDSQSLKKTQASGGSKSGTGAVTTQAGAPPALEAGSDGQADDLLSDADAAKARLAAGFDAVGSGGGSAGSRRIASGAAVDGHGVGASAVDGLANGDAQGDGGPAIPAAGALDPGNPDLYDPTMSIFKIVNRRYLIHTRDMSGV